jgi:hypothetical protein
MKSFKAAYVELQTSGRNTEMVHFDTWYKNSKDRKESPIAKYHSMICSFSLAGKASLQVVSILWIFGATKLKR